MDAERGALGAVQGPLPKFRRIHPADVEKPGAEALHIGSPEGAVPVELDVIPEDHDVPGAVGRVDASGGVGEDDGLDAQQLQHPDGDDQLLEGIALVGVEAAGHAGHPFPGHGAEEQLPGVGGHGGEQEVGDIGVIHLDGVLDGLGEGSQAGAQDNAHLRREAHTGPQVIRAGLKIFMGVGHRLNTPPGSDTLILT